MENIVNFFISDKRKLFFSLFLAFVFSFLTSIGFLIDYNYSTYVAPSKLPIFLVLTSILFLISFLSFNLLIRYQDKIIEFLNKFPISNRMNELFFSKGKKAFVACFLVITLAHIPAFLAYYPGIFTYDTWFQYDFFVYKYHVEVHPVFHSILIYLAILINKITHSAYTGVLLYTVFQQVITNLIFAHCVVFLSKRNVSFLAKLIALVFFALHPINQVFPLIATKDVFFSLFLLEVTIFAYNLLDGLKNNKVYKKDVLLFLFFVLLGLLTRHNFFYSYVLSIPFIFILADKNNKIRMKILGVLILPLLIFGGFNAIKPYFNITPPPVASSIGIPLQQMARVRIFHDDEVKEEDKALYASLVTELNSTIYNPLTVDFIKETEHTLSEMQSSFFMNDALKKDPMAYVNLWAKWGLMYPRDYIDAFLCMNYHYWYIGSNASNLHKRTGRISNAFIMTVNGVDDYWGTPVRMNSKLNGLRLFYNDLLMYSTFEYNPTKFLYAMSYNFWFFFIVIVLLFERRKQKLLLPLIFVGLTFFTVLFSPIALFRYIYQNYLMVPILFSLGFGGFDFMIDGENSCK